MYVISEIRSTSMKGVYVVDDVMKVSTRCSYSQADEVDETNE
jgi:hypothetical protein